MAEALLDSIVIVIFSIAAMDTTYWNQTRVLHISRYFYQQIFFSVWAFLYT